MLAPSFVLAPLMPLEARAQANVGNQAPHVIKTRAANRPLIEWLDRKQGWAGNWLTTRGNRGGMPSFIDFHFWNQPPALSPLTRNEERIAETTKALYDQLFPPSDPSSVLGTFFESGHPWVKTPTGEHQWNSLYLSGMEDPRLFDLAISKLVGLGIKSVRIAPNLHKIDPAKPSSWDPFVDMLETAWKHGATPTVSVAFFPSLLRWRTMKPGTNETDHLRSYLLHPRWAQDMGDLSATMMKKIMERAARFEAANPGKKANVVVNPINEPETFAGFNRHFWHEAHANWDSPEMMRFYVPSILNIAKANVLIRMAVEREARGKRILFMHNEAMTPDYYPSHKGGGRFAVSKFMIGDDVLMRANLDSRTRLPLIALKANLEILETTGRLTEVDWAIKSFVFGAWNRTSSQQEAARTQIIRELRQLKNLHETLVARTGKTMKTDNMLNLDYYYQTEFKLPVSVPQLVRDLAKNNGEKLKHALHAANDYVLAEMLKDFAEDEVKLSPGVPLILDGDSDLRNLDLVETLTREDYALLARSIGLRYEFSLKNEAPYVDRQKRAGLRPETVGSPEKIERTDKLLNELAASDGEKLVQVLGLRSVRELPAAIAAAATDTRDGGPVVQIKANETLRTALDKEGRAILNRLMGLNKNVMLGFLPNQYGRQIRAGIRQGFLKFFVDYVNALRIHTVGVGESGTPFYVFAPLLHDQVMMEYATALKLGLYGERNTPSDPPSTRSDGRRDRCHTP